MDCQRRWMFKMNKAIALKIAKACISLFLIFYILQGVHYLIFTRENKYKTVSIFAFRLPI